MSDSVPLPGFEGLTAGQTATLRVPIGATYLQIWLEYTGVTLAQMTSIRIVANGQQIGIYSAAELDSMNKYADRTASAGRLCIDFTRKNLRARDQEQLTGLATGGGESNGRPNISTLTIQLDVAAGATAPAIKVTAIQDNPKPQGVIMKVARFNWTFPSIGDNTISTIPKGDAIYRIFLFSSDISNVQIQRNQVIEYDRTKTLNTQIQKDGFHRTPVDDIFVIDTGEDGFGTESILTRFPTPPGQPLGPLIGDLRVIVKTTAADANVIGLIQFLGRLGG